MIVIFSQYWILAAFDAPCLGGGGDIASFIGGECRPSEDIGGPESGLSIADVRGIREPSSTPQAILQTLLFELDQGRGK